MIKKKKIKAGAIQYVLVVSVIIMIVLFSFVSLVFLQNRLQLKSELYEQTIQNSYAAFDYLSQKQVAYDTPIDLQFTDFENEKTTLIKKRWGLFDLAIVNSEINHEVNTKVALLGNQQENRKALYLKDNNQPLKLVGNTKIVGDVVLPPRGVSTGNISGVSYYGDRLIYGNIQKNSGRLPIIKNLEDVKQLIKEVPFEDVEYLNLQEGIDKDQSFTKETLIFETSAPLELYQMNLSGNIVLVSDSRINVNASSTLENIILIAPKIKIESGFEGTVQAYATDKLIVSSRVKLKYPSVLAMIRLNEASNDQKDTFVIQNGADVKGIILYHDDEKKNNYQSQLVIQENAMITGEIYGNKNIELRGQINGTVYANNFITRQSGGVYINHIYNGKIDSKTLSDKYVGLFVGEGKTKVAIWVE